MTTLAITTSQERADELERGFELVRNSLSVVRATFGPAEAYTPHQRR